MTTPIGCGPGGRAPSSAKEIIARRLRTQQRACEELGSPFYADLLGRAALDVEAGGVMWRALAGHEGDPGPSALALRLMGATHRFALDGRAPELAARYPSCRGDGDTVAAWAALTSLVESQLDEVRALIDRTVQTNEVGRCAALLGGFLVAADRTGRPLRILEVGASAGLNLRFDHYRYEDDNGVTWGPAASPLVLRDHWRGPGRPPLDGTTWCGVAERSGCDVAPIDPTTADGRLTLLSFVWPDQSERLARLRAALEVASSVAAPVIQADAGDWLAQQLHRPSPGLTTVVFHSVFVQYLTDQGRARQLELIVAAGRAATADQPLAWLRMEPANRTFDVRLTTWPGGDERLLATAGAHGRDVCWLAG